jgi:hypothetical protein
MTRTLIVEGAAEVSRALGHADTGVAARARAAR